MVGWWDGEKQKICSCDSENSYKEEPPSVGWPAKTLVSLTGLFRTGIASKETGVLYGHFSCPKFYSSFTQTWR
jgi:hypothetical protein